MATKFRILTLSLATFLMAGSVAHAAESGTEPRALAPENFSVTLTIANEYMDRGISNSDGPTVQTSLDWAWRGFFVGIWVTNTEFSDRNLEIDYYAGYEWNWLAIDWGVQAMYNTFPGERKYYSEGLDPDTGVSVDYGELNLSAFHTFDVALDPTVGVNYFYAWDYYGEEGAAHAIEGHFDISLPGAWGLYTNVGYMHLAGDQSGPYDYVYFSGGVTKEAFGFTLDLGYHGTDESSDLEAIYEDAILEDGHNFRDLIDGRIVFSISRTF